MGEIPRKNNTLVELSADQQMILAAVSTVQEPTSYRLSKIKEISMDSSRTAQVLKSLANRGLVRCSEVSTNGRGKFVYATTPSGAAAYAAYQAAWQTLKQLDPEDVGTG